MFMETWTEEELFTAQNAVLIPPVSQKLNAWCVAEQVRGMWPYWLDGKAPSTVRNTFDINSMLLLTGRSLFLSNCGADCLKNLYLEHTCMWKLQFDMSGSQCRYIDRDGCQAI